MRYQWMRLRMKVLCDQAFYKKMLVFQEKVVNATMHKGEEQMLEMVIQVAESSNMINRIICRNDMNESCKRDLKLQLLLLESKLTDFLSKQFDIPNKSWSDRFTSITSEYKPTNTYLDDAIN